MKYKALLIILLSLPLITYGKENFFRDLRPFLLSSNDTVIIDTSNIQASNDLQAESWLDEFISDFSNDTIHTDTIDLIPQIDTAWLKADTAIKYLQNKLTQDTLFNSKDTLKSHLKKLINYAQSLPIDTTLQYLNHIIRRDSILPVYADSASKATHDSVYNYLKTLLQYVKKDTTLFTIYNQKDDSISFPLTKNIKDSLRFLIYDQKDYPAGLWIYPNKNAMKISFYEGIQIIESKPQQAILEELSTMKNIEKLKKPKEVKIIFPQWDIGGIGNAYFNQGYLSNWAQGGESSLSSLLEVKFNIDYKKGKTIWDNDINYKYGLLKSGEKELRKNEDKLEINSKFGSSASNDWYYSTLVNFKTQFFKGYDYPNDSVPVSDFLAPAYLVFSVGMDYKPSNKLTVLLSPISSKFTIMRDRKRYDPTKYGLEKDQNVKKELGAYVKSIYKYELNEDINLENKINLFTNYLDKPQNVDIDWELTVNMKITDLITTTINTHIIYDDDINFPVYKKINGEEVVVNEVPKIQFKELLSVGVSYKF